MVDMFGRNKTMAGVPTIAFETEYSGANSSI